ncbi:MAG: calcium/sodium antiporter [Pseudomonadales bacterium]|nr:calcium/sodium antiporter [Pseudomonadales bacterium]
MLFIALLLLAGLIILGFGAEMLVSGSSRLSMRLGISPLIVGLTVVAFGTSAPELAVSIMSALSDHGSLALGNVIGSNIANIGLILGVTALICPIKIEVQLVRQEIPLMIVSGLIFGAMLLDGAISLVDGFLLSGGLFAYLYFSYLQAGKEKASADIDLAPLMIHKDVGTLPVHLMLIVLGLGLLILGSRLFVNNAVEMARLLGVSEAIIGLSLIAIGTSVPELATAILAALRKQSDLAVGNVIGSNIFNVLCVLGITALFSSLPLGSISLVDFIVMMMFALVLLPLARSGLTLSRKEGFGLLMAYVIYLGYLAWTA